MKLRALLLLPLLLPAAIFAAAPLEFSGVLIANGGKIQVFLLNTATLESRLIPVGGKFGGYIVEKCDNPTTTKPEIILVSVANGQKQTLRIKEVSVGVSAPVAGSSSALGIAPAGATTTLALPAGAAADTTAAAMAAVEAAAQARADAQAKAAAAAVQAADLPAPTAR